MSEVITTWNEGTAVRSWYSGKPEEQFIHLIGLYSFDWPVLWQA